jgi:hypothetical protein
VPVTKLTAQRGDIQGIFIDESEETFTLFGIIIEDIKKEVQNTMFTLTKPRPSTEMHAHAVQVEMSERGSNRDKQKLKSIATRGLEPVFVGVTTYLPSENGDKFVGGNASVGKTYEVERQISNFWNHMVMYYDMHSLFELQKIATKGTATTAP